MGSEMCIRDSVRGADITFTADFRSLLEMKSIPELVLDLMLNIAFFTSASETSVNLNFKFFPFIFSFIFDAGSMLRVKVFTSV